MVGTVCGTVRLSLNPSRFTAEVAGNGQSLKAARAGIYANYQLVLQRECEKANGRMNTGGCAAEVRRV
jgi:hypothetical protein